jgi:hypothetical protein
MFSIGSRGRIGHPPRAIPARGAKEITANAIVAPTGTCPHLVGRSAFVPCKGRKESRPKATAHEDCSLAFTRGRRCRTAARWGLSPLGARGTLLELVTHSSRPPEREVAQGSLSSLAAFPPRRGLGGAAQENPDCPACGTAKTRAAGRAAGPEDGPCATRSLPFQLALLI